MCTDRDGGPLGESTGSRCCLRRGGYTGGSYSFSSPLFILFFLVDNALLLCLLEILLVLTSAAHVLSL